MMRAEITAIAGLLLFFSAPAASADRLRLLTFNAAALPLVHPRMSERMREAGAQLAEGQYDLVALQEAWRDVDSAFLAEAAGLPHYARFRRDIAVGTGLSFLSAWPLEEPRQKAFTSRPSALRFYHGEWPANKGVLSSRLRTPSGTLDVFNTHLISSYPGAPYYTLRVTQVFDLAEEVLRRAEGRPYVLLGDFNMAPGEPDYALLIDLLDLEDACFEKGRDVCGPTIDGGRRVDHVFLPRGAGRFARARRALDRKLDGMALSDHAAVEVELDPKALSLKPRPDPARRRFALTAVMAAADKMVERMHERLRRRSWVPLYGLFMTLRYARHLDQLADIRGRAETARILEARR